ncbi:MucR family transcriptional regulator [Candidatus Entotheonella palauensis]|uniref:MucR family transcriptional regulator n=1 Tax=Candidatus Entotheonella palauensis TaxID=93172 RepID=UPI000B7D4C63|nr:MucR family transcriptional regulator [Candidatus Entotheonella palauensis]
MPQSLLEIAKELVVEQIRQYCLLSDETQALLLTTHETLEKLQRAEMSGAALTSPERGEESFRADWQRSITKHAVICMECGDTFRQLSSRHLRRHDLDARSYRRKYGIPRTQPLSSHRATARRRKLARQIPGNKPRKTPETAPKAHRNPMRSIVLEGL